MNRKGSFFFAILIAVMIFSSGMLALNFIKDDVTLVRNASNLDCANINISDGTKVTCLAMDLTIPYVFLLIFSAAGGLIASKLTL